jgi:aspartyl aminopeptidase
MAHTWFDRDLSISGRLVVRDGDQFCTPLVHLKEPILRIPNLSIHLTSPEEKAKGFQFNKENHLRPLLQTEAQSNLGPATMY